MKIIRGYQQGQLGGAALVTIDDAPLGLPTIDERRERRHSPDGFQWGYAGSGPTELARAILVAICRADKSLARSARCYQRFKFDVIARLPKESFELTDIAVRAWMDGFKASEEGQGPRTPPRPPRRRRGRAITRRRGRAR